MPTIEETIKALEKLKQDVPNLVGTEAVTFFRQGFKKGGFTDTNLVLWQKGYKSAGATLVKFGHLRDSIQILASSQTAVTIGSVGIRYAKLHNEGGNLPLTAKQRKFFWAKYYELVRRNRLNESKKRTGKAAEQRSSQAEIYRRMALAKTLKFPKRQFIGQSAELNRIVGKAISTQFKQLLKNE